jgi:hypothetical protein
MYKAEVNTCSMSRMLARVTHMDNQKDAYEETSDPRDDVLKVAFQSQQGLETLCAAMANSVVDQVIFHTEESDADIHVTDEQVRKAFDVRLESIKRAFATSTFWETGVPKFQDVENLRLSIVEEYCELLGVAEETWDEPTASSRG